MSWQPPEQPPTCQRCAFYDRYRPLTDLVDGKGATDCIDCNNYRDACIRDAAISGEHQARWDIEQLGCERCHTRHQDRRVKWRDELEIAMCDQCYHNKKIPESRW